MEIHPPHGPARSWSDVFGQLTIITATSNLRHEMAENVREVEGLFVSIAKQRRNLEHADDLAQMLLEQKKIENERLDLVFNSAELKDASRTTAEVTGAFGHMEYAEVERFAAVYGLQTEFNRAQERTNESFVTTLAGASLLSSPDKPDPSQVRQWKSQIALTGAALYVEEQLGQQLVKRYMQALEAQ